MHIANTLGQRFATALAGLVDDPTAHSLVRPAVDSKHGDYQMNAAMALAKQLGRKPRDIADEIVKRLALDDMLEPPEIAGPGFINLRLRSDWLAQQVTALLPDDRLGVAKVGQPLTIVIDYSSPNVAKPLHVGHLRSTIIGDSLARLLRFLGHNVIADNHLGDWGTQFGILLYGYKNLRDDAAYRADPLRELSRLYLHVRAIAKPADADEDDDPKLAAKRYTAEEVAEAKRVVDLYRAETAKLHTGDAENVSLWQQFMPPCMEAIHSIYRRLNVKFDHEHGESFYNPLLPAVVEDLLAKGIATETQGAIGVFRPDQPDTPPSLIRKRDGAFTYTTTDLATIRYRIEQFHVDVSLYVVDSRQAYHFQNLFEMAKRWGCSAELKHIAFGSVLGEDKKPLKTRDGGAVELGQLLDEAVQQAAAVKAESQRGDSASDPQLTEMIGLGAVKYADLSQHRSSDYVFSFPKMLAMTGNTAAYMQYAYARCRSIARNGGVSADGPITLKEPAERALGLQLLRFEEALTAAAAEFLPHIITGYLFDLAKAYSAFFDQCPVLKAPAPELKASRLRLCDLTARTIRQGLELLGIDAPDRM